MSELLNKVNALSAEAKAKVGEIVDHIDDEVNGTIGKIVAKIRTAPRKSVLVAFGIGVVIGFIFGVV